MLSEGNEYIGFAMLSYFEECCSSQDFVLELRTGHFFTVWVKRVHWICQGYLIWKNAVCSSQDTAFECTLNTFSQSFQKDTMLLLEFYLRGVFMPDIARIACLKECLLLKPRFFGSNGEMDTYSLSHKN